jgi:hypothetical protein
LQLEAEKVALREMRDLKSDYMDRRNEMQEWFMACVNTVKEQIERK